MSDLRTVVIASGTAETRERWSSALARNSVVCGVAALEMLQQVMAERKPGVLVLDIALPRLGGAEGLARLQKLSPATKTIVICEHEAESEGVDALMAGAKGYCDQAIDPAALAKAVESVANGELWVKRTLVHALVAALVSRAGNEQRDPGNKPDRRRLERLTHRQREVADAIAHGASNKEIANRLNVTERTVKAHLTEMFRNVGVYDRLRLALLLNDVSGAGYEWPATQAAPGSGVPASRRRNGVARADAAQPD